MPGVLMLIEFRTINRSYCAKMEVVTTTQNVEGRTVNQPWRKIVVTVLELGSETTILAWNSANTGPASLTELVTVYVARDCPAGIVTYP